MLLNNFKLEKLDLSNFEQKSLFINLSNDPLVVKHLGYLDILYEEVLNSDKKHMYSLYKKDTGYIGIVMLSSMNDFIDIRYMILNEYRNKGYASLLLSELSSYFSTSVSSLSLTINPSNIYSIKVAYKNDFKKEGFVKYVKKF